MATILLFQHADLEVPGRLGATLRDHGVRPDVRRPDRDGPRAIPPDLDNIHAVIALGGPQNVADALPWMGPEMACLRAAHERNMPVIGICLGAQMLAAALGGRVDPMPAPEWGLLPVSLTTAGQTEPMLAGVPWTCPQFLTHEHMIAEAPPGAAVLARSAACPIQAFRCGLRTFGFQYHFECDRAAIEGYARREAEVMARAGFDAPTLAHQLDAKYPMFARVGDRLSLNIATFAFPFDRRISA
jgi:GMP synthase-like glutamine amidotransferase